MGGTQNGKRKGAARAARKNQLQNRKPKNDNDVSVNAGSGALLRACEFGAQSLPYLQVGLLAANMLTTPVGATSDVYLMDDIPSASGLLLLDFLILLSDICGFCAFLCVFKSVQHGGPKGVSLQSFLGFAMGRCLHSLSHVFGIHYIPEMFPSFMYVLVDGLSVVMGCICAAALYVSSKGDSECFADDVFGRELLKKLFPVEMHNSKVVQHGGLIVVSIVVASIWSVTRCSLITSADDVPYAFALCLLCSICEVIQIMSVLPQLLMLYKTRRIPALLGDFLMFQGVAKACTLTFWLLFPSVNGWSPHNHNMATMTEFFNLLVLSDFIYFYIKSKANSRAHTKDFVMDDMQSWV